MPSVEPYKYSNNDTKNIFFDFEPFKNLESSNDWLTIADWKYIDSLLRTEIEYHKNLDGYSLCVQTMSTYFLDKHLLKTNSSGEKSTAIKYYLSLLVEENNNYWPLLTKALLAIKNKLDLEEYSTLKNYIKNSALLYIETNRDIEVNSGKSHPIDQDTYHFIQERLAEAEQCLLMLE